MKNRIIEEDLAFLNALGLKEDEVSLKDEDIDLVIKCFDNNYYSSTYKVEDTFHCPFTGINDFGSGMFLDYLNIFPINSFDETAKLIAMMHGTDSLDANLNWLVSDVDNPSISECICFRDELSSLDNQNEKHICFMKEVKYLPLRDWIERHTKIIFSIAKVYINEPLRYYKAYIHLHKDTFLKVVNDRDYVESVIKEKDFEKEKMYALLIDIKDRGYTLDDVLWR